MFLHEDKELFKEVVYNTSNELNLPLSIIEKDYFVTLFLKELVKRKPDIIFKGGTSLSKCYKLIDRFSEDIDLNIAGDTKPGEGMRKKLKKDIISVIDDLGFSLTDPESIKSRREFNKYVIEYPTEFNADFLKQHLIVETAIFFRAYPTEAMNADSFIYQYLLNNGHTDIIDEFDLVPFEISVQTADRTFVDKLFALGDYYLAGTINGHSRHIYDLYKLIDVVEINDDLRALAKMVREERKLHKTCLSAMDDVDMNFLINRIVKTEAYREDYEKITSALLFKPLEYDAAIKVLDIVLEEEIF
jgi:predicted nucleotidyltransferase component of viral defense system